MKETQYKEAQQHFDRVPNQWDALYSSDNPIKYFINRWLRKGLFERYRLTFEHAGVLDGTKVLDIGCGTGRFSIECAKRGASKVIGIDFAPLMIDYSSRVAREMQVTDKCEFICDDFLLHKFDGTFDVILALGLFDYIKDPAPLFKKIALLAPHTFVASFPKHSLFWGIQRHIRYRWIKKCPIYYYSAPQVEQLCHEAGFSHQQIFPCTRGFFLVADAH